MKLVEITKEAKTAMLFIEERRGVIQKLIKFVSQILIKLSRWLQPRRK